MNSDVRSISTLAGIVNGTGSIAAALIQVIIPLLKSVSFFVYFGNPEDGINSFINFLSRFVFVCSNFIDFHCY